MIKDRGLKKWTAMVLPEHRLALMKLSLDQQYIEKPNLDEQQLAQINQVINEAMANNQIVEVDYYKDHSYQTISGRIIFLDWLTRSIKLEDEHKKTHYLVLDNVLDIQCC
jgi:hypothetical protein